jgi:hypothetical protein
MALSMASRVAGAALALGIAADQSYDRTQVLTVVIAVLVLATLAPLPRGQLWAAGIGAGLLFFGGTNLSHLTPGAAMMAMGALGGLAALGWEYRRSGLVGSSVSGFFLGSGLSFLLILGDVLLIEG